MDEALVDLLAEQLRLEYARVEPRVSAHVERHPWADLGEDRRAKWKAMARASYTFFYERGGV